MLYDYKLTLAQMGQIKNYKIEKDFKHILLNIKDIELSTFEVDCKISYKKTVPLNMFEKYSIRLIEKADEIYADMSISKIARLLHLDENLVRENLENLQQIGMINGIESDIITINKDENSIYLQYENKFKIESIEENFHLTQTEYENIDEYILKEFEKESNNRDKKFKEYSVLDEKSSSKKVKLLNYGNKFLIYSKNGINSQNDLKFINADAFDELNMGKVPDNVFCHFDEFLPLLRDKVNIKKNEIIVIGSKDIEKDNLNILPSNRDKDIYILSSSQEEHKRIFNIESSDFAWIGDEFFTKEGDYVIQRKNTKLQLDIQKKLKNYFINKISEIEPNYDLNKLTYLDNKISLIKDKLNNFEFKTKKEIDEQIKKINTEKNKLYGLKSKKTKVKADIRKKIDKLMETNNLKELEKYPIFLQNKDRILKYKEEVISLENNKNEIKILEDEINKVNQEKAKLISKENQKKIALFEKELNNIKRLKI